MSPALDAAFFKSIPDTPGVYFMLGACNEILYIGKAKCLRKRLCCYRNVSSKTHALNVVQLVQKIHRIRWEQFRTETEAVVRENELLHAVRPPFNIADTEPESYFFIVIRRLRREGYFEFSIASAPDIEADSLNFGCYKNRLQTKRGFISLLRLIHSATFEGRRFSIPSRLGNSRTVYSCTLKFAQDWIPALAQFLRGESLGFLRTLSETLISNEAVPRFMGPALQDDIDRARLFFRSGPRATRRLKRGSHARLVSHAQMDECIRRTVLILDEGHPNIQS